MTSVWASWITLLSPLAAALVITLAGTSLSRRVAGIVATTGTSVAFVAAVVAFVDLLGEDGEQRSHLDTAWTWLAAGNFRIGVEILVDPLSVFMMLVVSGVGSLIVAYSLGYMDGGDEERRFFAYMALFVFSMLLLVQGGNLLMMLLGWGLVGLSSYLLIGFHHERPSAIAAAKKAFIMNAFGDATFALALFLLIAHNRSLSFDALGEIDGASSTVRNLVALGLLGGAVAKSAQLPLHTWLPDAMEGPTPVSALIHAATMVTAGVYLIVRAHEVFEAAWVVQNLAAIIGAVTLLVAGLIALVQTDIKRVIAYSTMSQIGYMFLGAGLGAYANAMFHLMTHAFFKALLFLAAGVVIHALAGEQDMRRMGGLKRLMPFTYWCFLIGALALVGIPPLAGFFSKDSILAAALDRGALGAILFSIGIVGTFLTGLYTFRMLYLVFHGPRSVFVSEHHHRYHGREGPAAMLVPVAVLAALSVVGGWLQFAGVWTPVTDFLDPVAEQIAEANTWKEILASVLAVALGICGMLVAWAMYSARSWRVPSWRPVRRVLEEKLYWDRLYDWIFYIPASWSARAIMRWFERPVIAGSAIGIGVGARESGELASEVQTGYLRAYALAIAAGLAVLVLVFISVK